MKTFRHLKVWNKSMIIVKEIYSLTDSFPKKEIFSLTSQMRRCAISVPSNIAEGFGRFHKLDMARFIGYSLGSLYELETQIEISYQLEYIEENRYVSILQQITETKMMLLGFIKSLRKK